MAGQQKMASSPPPRSPPPSSPPSSSSSSLPSDLSYLFPLSDLAREWNALVQRGEHTTATNAKKAADTVSCRPPAKKQIQWWNWGDPQPDADALRRCLRSLSAEQSHLCREAADTTLFSARLRRRIILLRRHMVDAKRAQAEARAAAEKRTEAEVAAAEAASKEKEKAEQASINKSQELNVRRGRRQQHHLDRRAAPREATRGLAKIGSRAALSFAFSFLRRAWRSGEDGDLCSDLLEETLDAVLTLPEASLFHAGETISGVWMEVVERATKFFRSVVIGGEPGLGNVPKRDRHLALNLLLEFSVQKGTLAEMLGAVMLLFHVWSRERGGRLADNRERVATGSAAPLVGFLKRLEAVEPSCCRRTEEDEEEEQWDDYENVSATQTFLKYLEYPDSDETPIDLKQTAVVVMSHLDRLTIPHQPVLEPNTVRNTNAVQSSMLSSWQYFSSFPQPCSKANAFSGWDRQPGDRRRKEFSAPSTFAIWPPTTAASSASPRSLESCSAPASTIRLEGQSSSKATTDSPSLEPASTGATQSPSPKKAG